ncbi:MAG: endonuclease/exonuclease/phosphatase family protein [Pseudomonadota bacterium]
MRVMCLNAWGGKLYEQLLPYLALEAPDILCLQEVVHSPASEKLWLTYRDGDHILPQRANFFREVSVALPDHRAVFCPAAQGTLWDENTRVPSQWGLATFVHKNLTQIGQIQGFVHKDFGPDGYGNHPRSRSAHGVRIWDFDNNRALSVLHMHGLRDLAGKEDTPDRLKQAKRLHTMTLSLAEHDDAMILCGDFNVLPGSATFDILSDLGVSDLVTGHNHDGTRTSHYSKPTKFADYMLVNDVLSDADFAVIRDPEVSDHCPLVLTL